MEDAGLSISVDGLLRNWHQPRTHLQWMLLDGYSIATVNVRLSTVRIYAQLAATADALSPMELALIEHVKGYSLSEGQNVDAQLILISAKERTLLKQQSDTPQGRRDTLQMCLLLDHGLRCGEVVDLVQETLL